jgi:hypothetical protein
MGDVFMYGALIVGFVGAVLYVLNKKKKAKEKYKKYSNSTIIKHAHGVTLLPSKDRYLTFDRIVEIYHEVMSCTGLDAMGPEIEFCSYKERLGIDGGWGHYMPATKRIIVNSDNELSQTAEDELLRHEFIHHLLEQNGMHEESITHGSKLFQCGPGVSTENGKVLRP